MDTRPIRFVHRGQIVQVSGVATTRTLLDWLREDARCSGTKEGCGEGDCGACTIIVAELADGLPASAASTVIGGAAGLSLRPVNACIRLLATLDGKALLTVEDLGTATTLHPVSTDKLHPVSTDKLHPVSTDTLHPVQRSMVDCHGSQCGFCTPGFVMSMFASYERNLEAGTIPGRQALADDLAGTLCRCTGYRPIIDAGEQMFKLPPQRLDIAPLVKLLQTLRADAPLHYAAPTPAASGRINHFHAPRNVDELAAALQRQPQATLLAGATDIGLWLNKQFRDLGDIVYLGEVASMQAIEVSGNTLQIGAAAPLEDAWAAIAAHWPSLREVGLRFAGPPVRHAGTLGGNIANGSPIGDGAPVLMALDATLLLRQGARLRTLRLDEFYIDYMKSRLEAGEFVQAIQVPLPQPGSGAGTQLRAYKISKRYDCDISALCAAFSLRLDGGRVAHVRVAFGGMAAVVKRAAQAEAAMLGQLWNEATLDAAIAALDIDFSPITDLRASADYRRQVAGGLLKRFWLETRADAPMAAPAVSVWATA